MAATCVSYYPSEAETQRFWNGELTRQNAIIEVPSGFPNKLESPLAWTRAEAESKQSEWKLDLTSGEIVAIDAALVAFEDKYEDLSSLSASTFELPATFSQRLRGLSDHLYNGVGFQIIHGLDPSKYTERQKIIVYAGVSAHICPQRGFVDVVGKGVVAHVVNVQTGGVGPESTAPAFSNIPLSFHTDNCEIMAFFYLDTALKGGETILASSWKTYNELAAKRPEVLRTLAEPWVLDTFKSYAQQPPRHVRFLQKIDSDKIKVLFRFSRYPITGWQRKRNPNLPEPTKAQLEAVDAVQFTAMKHAITLPVVKGDMLFVNDMAMFHARTEFDDGGIPLKRHLAKMFFRDPDKGWDIPLSMEKEWRKTYSPNQPDGTRLETWHILHEPGLEEMTTVNG